MKHILSFVVFIFISINSSSSQTQVILNPVKDNTLYETPGGSTSNGAGDFLFVGRVGANGGGAIRRTLIKFDVVSVIPSGAAITSAVLTMRMSKTTSGPVTIALHKLLSDWGEGTSNANTNEGPGASSSTGDATWIHKFFNTSSWTNAGGDFSSTVSASASVNGIGSYTWTSTNQIVTDVQDWLNSSSTNFGWIMIGEESAERTAKRFDSRQNPTVANRPKLTITYTTATGVKANSLLPSETVLEQNYPNPFNPTTTISFTLAEDGFASLKVYNILGSEVVTLVNEKNKAGIQHSVTFDASKLSSGIYFYRLDSGKSSIIKKLTLLR